MRIGMLVDVYKPHVSGITNYVTLNKRVLEASGHEVYVFTFGDESHPDDEPRIIRSAGLPILNTGYYIGLDYSQKAQKFLKTMDIVHVHHPFLSGSLAVSHCRIRGIPIVFTNHTRYDLYAQAYLPGITDVIGVAAIQAYLPVFCRLCNLVIAPSPGMHKVLMDYKVDARIEVVPNGVELDPFRQPCEPIDRADFGFKPKDVILAYSGRLGPEKNLHFLLRSFAGTLQAYDHAGLLIIGDGPDRENLEDQVHHTGIESRVRFVGMVPYPEMPRYLAMADAFVTASVTEVHPLSIIEAMAAGLPILGIKSPGIGDTITDGVTGYLAPEEDMASFTAKMVRLVIDRENRLKMSEQARQEAENYAIEKTNRTMMDIYQRVIYQASLKKRNLRTRLTNWINGFLR